MKKIFMLFLVISSCWSYETINVALWRGFELNGKYYERTGLIIYDTLEANSIKISYEESADEILETYCNWNAEKLEWETPYYKIKYKKESGRIVESQTYDWKNGEFVKGNSNTKYYYNNKGLLILTEIFFANNHTTHYLGCKYNNDNNIDYNFSISNDGDTTITGKYNYIDNKTYESLYGFDNNGNESFKNVLYHTDNGYLSKIENFKKENEAWIKTGESNNFVGENGHTDSLITITSDTVNSKSIYTNDFSGNNLSSIVRIYIKNDDKWKLNHMSENFYRISDVPISSKSIVLSPNYVKVRRLKNSICLSVSPDDKILNIKMFDMRGKKIWSKVYNFTQNASIKFKENLIKADGAYTMNISTLKGKTVTKVLIQE